MNTDNADADGTVSAGTALARGYSWPTATAGNTIAVTHGARSPRLEDFVAGRIEELTDELFVELPHLSRADFLAVKACATAEAIVERLTTYALDHGVMTEGKPAPVLGHLLGWMKRAEAARARIGADPRSARDLAIGELTVRDLAAELQAASATRERRMAELHDRDIDQ